VAFSSEATNLVFGDSGARDDVFVNDSLNCSAGTVNSGIGPVANVLRVNGSSRVATVAVREPIEVRLSAAPLGPDPAAYVLWLWKGLPANQRDLFVGGSHLGCAANPTPFDAGTPPGAFKCLIGGLGPEYRSGVNVLGMSPAGAPWMRRRNGGFVRPITFTLQGVLEDFGAGNAEGLSVTNAVILRVE
jgi:hypothetical protein